MTVGNDDIDKEIEDIIHKKDSREDPPSVLKSPRAVYRKFSPSPYWLRLKKPLQWSFFSVLLVFLFFPMRQNVVLSGKVIPLETVTIDARVGGVVIAVEASNGEKVQKGDVLVRIKNTAMAREEVRLGAKGNILREEIMGLSDERDEERLRLAMHRQLFDAGEISRMDLSVHETEFQKVENRLKVKEAELIENNIRYSQTKEDQEYGTVISPVDGVVTSPIKQVLNTVVKEGDPLCEIASGEWQFEFEVKEDILSSIERGDVLTIMVPAFPSEIIRARVDEIRPIVYEDRPQPWLKSNNARIILSVVSPIPTGLRLGMTAKSSVLSKNRKSMVWRWWSEWRDRMG